MLNSEGRFALTGAVSKITYFFGFLSGYTVKQLAENKSEKVPSETQQ